jgi:hypothetical protein
MKKRTILLLGFVLFLIAVILLFFILLNKAYGTKIEKVTMLIPLTNEKIYLKHLSRGISYEMNVISKHSHIGSSSNFKSEYIDSIGRLFFYKVSQDSIIIFGSSWINSNAGFVKNIRFVNIEDEIVIYKENYKRYGLEVFPPSHEKYLKSN